MPKLAANLTMLFTEMPFMERFAAARQAGFKQVEYLFPYDYDMATIKASLAENGLEQVLFNLPCGDWAAGERGIGSLPDRISEFRAGVGLAIKWAKELGVPRVNCLAGKRQNGVAEEEHWQTLVSNMQYAADQLAHEGLMLVVEPINHYDIPGFFLNTADQAFKLLDEVNKSNVFVQYDIYHAYREAEPIAEVLKNSIGRIGHIQVADAPGRHQPGTGEIDYAAILKLLDDVGYAGVVAMEYIPQPDTVQSLEWVKKLGYHL